MTSTAGCACIVKRHRHRHERLNLPKEVQLYITISPPPGPTETTPSICQHIRNMTNPTSHALHSFGINGCWSMCVFVSTTSSTHLRCVKQVHGGRGSRRVYCSTKFKGHLKPTDVTLATTVHHGRPQKVLRAQSTDDSYCRHRSSG